MSTLTIMAQVKALISIVTFVAFFTISNIECNRQNSPFQSRVYQVKPQKFSDVTQALNHMHRFLTNRMSTDEKCERYAVLLHTATTNGAPDDLAVADLAMIRPETLHARYQEINAESLRFMYVDALNKYRSSKLAAPFVDLVDCLSKFRSFDATARMYLNDPELNRLVEDYKQVLGLPVASITRGCLELDRFAPIVQDTFRQTFAGFVDHNRVCASANAGASANAIANANAHASAGPNAAAVAVASPGAPVAAVAVAPQPPLNRQPPQHHRQPPPPHHNYRPPPPQSPPPQTPPPQSPQPSPEPEVHRPEPAPSAPSPPPEEAHQDQTPPPLAVPLNDEEAQFVEEMIDGLVKTYSTLPENAQLYDRCLAYRDVLDGSGENVSQVADEVVRSTAERIAKVPSTDRPFKPDKAVLESFLFILRSFSPYEQTDRETYYDLVDCVSQSADVDAEVRAFLDHPETKALLEAPEHCQGDQCPPTPPPTPQQPQP